LLNYCRWKRSGRRGPSGGDGREDGAVPRLGGEGRADGVVPGCDVEGRADGAVPGHFDVEEE
jgi:hypothetical protein